MSKKDEKVLKRVKEIKEYCEEYGEWPKQFSKYQTEREKKSTSLWHWLNYSNYNKEDFKYANIITKVGISVKEELDELFKEYGRINKKSNEYILNKVKEIKKYCESYGKWPRQMNNPKNEQEKLSLKLSNWLYVSKYYKEDFKYATILTENGISVKEELDKLFKQYGRTNQKSKEYVLKKVKEIKMYCESYGQWPKQFNNPKTEQEKLSLKLSNWLYFSKYYKEDFKYANIITEEGISVKEKLDKLFKEYGIISRKSNEYVLIKVKEIKMYCESYGEWPKHINNFQTVQEKQSTMLWQWLYYSNYDKEEFKYANILTEEGITVKEELDKLFKQYGRINKKSNSYILIKLLEIKEYCEEYKEWPKNFSKYQTEKEKQSKALWNWLYKNKYSFLTNEFKYSNILVENSLTAKEYLDRLYTKYNYIFLKVKAIKEYCEEYGQWPRQFINPKTEQEKLSLKLYEWLKYSGYNQKQFKYRNVLTEEGVSVKDILDRYYAIYTKRKLEMVNTELLYINLWKAKNSKDIAFNLYYCIIKLDDAIRDNDEVMVKYYFDYLDTKLKDNLIIGIDNILDILALNKEDRLEIVSNLYFKYSIENNKEVAILFKNLYYYWNNVNVYKRVR